MSLQEAQRRLYDFDRIIHGNPDSCWIANTFPPDIHLKSTSEAVDGIDRFTRIISEEFPKASVDSLIERVVIPIGRKNLEATALPSFVKTLFSENCDTTKSGGLHIAIMRTAGRYSLYLREIDLNGGLKHWAYVEANGRDKTLFVNINATDRSEVNLTYCKADDEIYEQLLTIQNSSKKEEAMREAASQIFSFIRSVTELSIGIRLSLIEKRII
jgi:hypothetical protein